MPNPTIRIHDTETDEVIDREMTAAEYKTYLEDQKTAEAMVKAKEEAIAKKQAVLEKLGLTAEEVASLLA
jgi:hypothetical protein